MHEQYARYYYEPVESSYPAAAAALERQLYDTPARTSSRLLHHHLQQQQQQGVSVVAAPGGGAVMTMPAQPRHLQHVQTITPSARCVYTARYSTAQCVCVCVP